MFSPMINYRTPFSAALTVTALAVLSLSGCKAPQAFGDRNSIIVRAESALWAEVDSAVMATLEQRAYTTRPERIFKATFVAASDTLWPNLRKWHQVLVLGTLDDPVVAHLVNSDVSPPAVVYTRDVWARTQGVAILLLPQENQAEAVRALLPELYDQLRARYDEWVTERMYTTGVNDSLSQALADFGFTLQLPGVYIHSHEDSLFRFGNPYRQGDTDLLRSVLLTWREGTDPVTAEELRAWREGIGETYFDPQQEVLEEGIRFDSVEIGGLARLELRGVWQDNAEFPAAGPFVTRAIACPSQNRTYYIDGWVFAPGTDKYPYLRQIEILLDTFRCVD
ncbi:MAG: hypothetical protein AMS21_04265 [Gemmatimonas sp. SG8_38_2]|nr:MAG: hypothetical protein AMS21_04265 [Gemmatimonas sp. SG8_38_2]